MSKITCNNVSKKVRIRTFRGPFLGSLFAPNLVYFPNTFQASILSVRFTCFVQTSNRWTLKKQCISAVKHVFQQGLHIYHNVGKTTNLHPFRAQFSTVLASMFITFSVSISASIFEVILDAFYVQNGSKMGPKSTQNRSKNASRKSSKKGR